MFIDELTIVLAVVFLFQFEAQEKGKKKRKKKLLKAIFPIFQIHRATHRRSEQDLLKAATCDYCT